MAVMVVRLVVVIELDVCHLVRLTNGNFGDVIFPEI